MIGFLLMEIESQSDNIARPYRLEVEINAKCKPWYFQIFQYPVIELLLQMRVAQPQIKRVELVINACGSLPDKVRIPFSHICVIGEIPSLGEVRLTLKPHYNVPIPAWITDIELIARRFEIVGWLQWLENYC